MLREIAEADYEWRADECYALLHPMLKPGPVAAAADFNVREVLELIRAPGATGCGCSPASRW